MSSANKDNFTSYITFYCLVALGRTHSTVLNRSYESWHSCLVPDLREKVSKFQHCR